MASNVNPNRLRRLTFLTSRLVLPLLLLFNLLLLGASIYLGYKSANQMRDIVREDFNQQQLALARHTAGMLEQDLDFLKRELSTLNFSPAIQYLEPLTWGNRMRATMASVRLEGVVEIRRVVADGQRAYLVDERSLEHVITGNFKEDPYLLWAARPENKGRVLVGPVSTVVPNYMGRLIFIMAIPTYEESADESHPHPSGNWNGVLVFYIDAHIITTKFTKNIRSGKTGYAWIVNNEGIFLSHPEQEFIGKNAFTVRKARMPAISFDAINEIQREKMLAGKEGWGSYISGWHGGLEGEIPKLIAYAPVRVGEHIFGKEAERPITWSVAVVAPESEVLGVVHSLYLRQFLIQAIIGLLVLSGTIVVLNFRYERQFSATLETELERQREQLQRTEARYQALVENAQDLIYTVDPQGRIESLNRSAAEFFAKALALKHSGEVDPRMFMGWSLEELFSPKSATFHREWMEEVQRLGSAPSKRHQVTVGEQDFWFSTSIVGLKDEKGQIYSYEVISRNITGRKLIEDRMINMEKLASIGTLAAGVAHEINNPMTVILGFTEHLLEKTEDLPEVHEILEIVEEEGVKCKKIVEKLLTFARSPEHTEKYADINALLERMLSVIKNTLLTKKINLVSNFAPDLPRVNGDPTELQQVFINLVNNAMDAMKGGGELNVSTRLSQDGKRVLIEVADTGNGIPEDIQARIFDPFFTTKPPGVGTGLGLSIVYGIISKFGGTITCKSFPAENYPDKHGTTFTVALPVAPAEELQPEPETRPAASPGLFSPLSVRRRAGPG
uniref:histidine kinase n=1 Tax=Desulfobacca acetoxidans TaxID=60893 RepID=A0A7V4LDA2_9BACT